MYCLQGTVYSTYCIMHCVRFIVKGSQCKLNSVKLKCRVYTYTVYTKSLTVQYILYKDTVQSI